MTKGTRKGLNDCCQVAVFEDMRVGMGWAYVGKVKPIMAVKKVMVVMIDRIANSDWLALVAFGLPSSSATPTLGRPTRSKLSPTTIRTPPVVASLRAASDWPWTFLALASGLTFRCPHTFVVPAIPLPSSVNNPCPWGVRM